jgi:hypothetical protein
MGLLVSDHCEFSGSGLMNACRASRRCVQVNLYLFLWTGERKTKRRVSDSQALGADALLPCLSQGLLLQTNPEGINENKVIFSVVVGGCVRPRAASSAAGSVLLVAPLRSCPHTDVHHSTAG